MRALESIALKRLSSDVTMVGKEDKSTILLFFFLGNELTLEQKVLLS